MAPIDQDKALREIDARIAQTASERQRAMLNCVREHIRAETYGEFDALMRTMSPEPAFNFWGGGTRTGPHGTDAVERHYRQLYVESRHIFEVDIERIVVDDRTVVTEGWFHQAFPGASLRARGIESAEEGEAYIVAFRLLLLWPFDEEGRLIGEDSYLAGGGMIDPANVRKLDPAERDEVLAMMKRYMP